MSRADKLTSTAKKEYNYIDFLINLDKHPLNGSLARVTNEESVRQSIRTLLLTDQYERPYQPTIGSKIYSLLFEPMDNITVNLLKRTIEDTIRIHEPRAKLLEVLIYPNDGRNEYNINIIFSLINANKEIQLDLIIKRNR